MPVGIFTSNTKKIMVTTKYHISKLTKKKLSISEIFSNNLAYSLNGYEFKNKKIYFKDLNPLEIHGNIKCKISPSFLIKNKFWMMKKTNQLI